MEPTTTERGITDEMEPARKAKQRANYNNNNQPTNYESQRAYEMVRHYRLQECHRENWKFYNMMTTSDYRSGIGYALFRPTWDDRSVILLFRPNIWTTGVMLEE